MHSDGVNDTDEKANAAQNCECRRDSDSKATHGNAKGKSKGRHPGCNCGDFLMDTHGTDSSCTRNSSQDDACFLPEWNYSTEHEKVRSD